MNFVCEDVPISQTTAEHVTTFQTKQENRQKSSVEFYHHSI